MKGNFFKKMSAFAAVLSLLAISCRPAAAASEDVIDKSRTGSLTIRKYDKTAAEQDGVSFTANGETDTAAEAALAAYALKGVEFTCLRVADLTTETAGGEIRILYDLPSALDAILSLSTDPHTSDELNASLGSLLGDNTTAKNTLESYVTQNGGTAMEETDDSGRTGLSGLALGLYLVVETRVPEAVSGTTDPFFVSLPMTDASGDYWVYDVTVYPKNQTNRPTLDKLVSENGVFGDTATGSEGDVLDYRIVSKLPEITSRSAYLTEYTFEDRLSEGLTYNRDVFLAFYQSKNDAQNGTGTPSALWDASGVFFKADYEDSVMRISMTDEGLSAMNPGFGGQYLAVIYTVTVKSDDRVVLGDEGNPNDVTLTYSRTNTVYTDTLKDEAIVHSYGIQLCKSFSGEGADATAVQFVLMNATDHYYVTAQGEKGVYHAVGQSATEYGSTAFSPSEDGTLVINGLEADTYVLTEIRTDDGYSLLKDPITVVIKPTETAIAASAASVTGKDNPNADVSVTILSCASAKVDGSDAGMSSDESSEHALVDVSVLNTRTFLLPQTGGAGTLLFTLGGALAVLAGILLLTGKRQDHFGRQ